MSTEPVRDEEEGDDGDAPGDTEEDTEDQPLRERGRICLHREALGTSP